MEYFIADPEGNITAFVPGPPDQQAAERLLALDEIKIEQVAFLRPPDRGGHIKCDMAGGEFCGNACRAAAFYYARTQERLKTAEAAEVLVEMSGTSQDLVKVTVLLQQGTAFAHVPLPQRIITLECEGLRLDAVVFEGIAHIVTPSSPRGSVCLSKELMGELCRRLGTAALGVMFLSEDHHLEPVVWVDQIGSLIRESSCGSGTAACAWWLSRDLKQGYREYRFIQPGGTLTVMIDRSTAGCNLQIGGRVRLLDDPFWRKL